MQGPKQSSCSNSDYKLSTRLSHQKPMATASRFGGVLDENASARTFSSKPTTVQRTALGNLTNTRASQKPRQGKASSSSSACQPLSCGPRKREARTKPTFSTEDMEASRMAFKLRVKQEEEDGPDFDYMGN